jgi:hypothetical protein
MQKRRNTKQRSNVEETHHLQLLKGKASPSPCLHVVLQSLALHDGAKRARGRAREDLHSLLLTSYKQIKNVRWWLVRDTAQHHIIKDQVYPSKQTNGDFTPCASDVYRNSKGMQTAMALNRHTSDILRVSSFRLQKFRWVYWKQLTGLVINNKYSPRNTNTPTV